MTKRKPRAKRSLDERVMATDPVGSAYDGVDFESHVGVDNKKIFSIAMDQIGRSVSKDVDYLFRFYTAREMLGELKPRDMQEGLLCTQMITTHHQLMECYSQAMIPGQTFEGRDMALKHGVKLASLFARQLEALDKHRGKGQQKITVEHVHVHNGGQAIVGNVHSSATGRNHALPDNPQAALPEPEQEAMQIIEPSKSAKAKASNKK